MGMGTWGITEYTISREKLHELLPEQVEEVEAIHLDIWSIAARSLEVYTDPLHITCLLYTSPSPRDMRRSRMPSSA